jgi:hypothetical protein
MYKTPQRCSRVMICINYMDDDVDLEDGDGPDREDVDGDAP